MDFEPIVCFGVRNRIEGERRVRDQRRLWLARRVFELSARELEELWPGLERILKERPDGTTDQ